MKLAIKQEGWYRVTREELVEAGLAKDANTLNLQLIVDGVEQPMLVVGKESGSFESFEAIEFYGVGTDSPYSNQRTYWLVEGSQPGRRVPVINTKPDSKGAASFPFTSERKERTIYFSALLNGDAENWFEQPITIRSLDEAAQDKAQLEIALQGVTSRSAISDHQVDVISSGSLIGRMGNLELEEQIVGAQSELARASADHERLHGELRAREEAAERAELELNRRRHDYNEINSEREQINRRLQAGAAQVVRVMNLATRSDSYPASTYPAALAVLQADVDMLNVQLDEATARAERSRRLFNQGVVPRSEIESAETRAASLSLELVRARERLEAALIEHRRKYAGSRIELEQTGSDLRAQHLQTELLSNQLGAARELIRVLESRRDLLRRKQAQFELLTPCGGTVYGEDLPRMVRRYFQKGEEICRVADTEQLLVRIQLPEREIGDVRVGHHVRLRVRACPDRVFQGTVSNIGGESERDEHNQTTYRVELVIKNAEGLLRPGMTAFARIDFGRQISRARRVSGWSFQTACDTLLDTIVIGSVCRRLRLRRRNEMNQHSRTRFNLLARAWVGFVSLFCSALLVCLPANATQIETQQTSWSPTGSLGTARVLHTATLLANGKVLVVGGFSASATIASAELYDPATGAWSDTGNLVVPRGNHIAVRLPNGKVLAAGGQSGATTLSSAELYDPDTGAWSATGNLNAARAFATATLLANGKVLIAGGSFGSSALDTAELYDPATGGWSPDGTMNGPRSFHTATLLADGRVLIASGAGGTLSSPILLFSAELYDSASGSWTPTGSLGTARPFHKATLLTNGKVLVVGGTNFTSIVHDTAELYDPATGQWSATGSMTTPRQAHTATLLANGKVLVAGNILGQKSAELYDSATGSWTETADLLSSVRLNHVATLLADGRVLVSGGNGPLASAELFEISTAAPPQITGASISGKKLFVEGQNFDGGAKVLLNNEQQKTANDEVNPTTLLRCKKAGRFVASGETVRLKVRNADGTESAEFSYTRPLE